MVPTPLSNHRTHVADNGVSEPGPLNPTGAGGGYKCKACGKHNFEWPVRLNLIAQNNHGFIVI